jgi:hypothetical protein
MGWWNDDGPKCNRCHEPTSGCADCKGDGRVSQLLGSMECSVCAGTGWLCTKNNHGKYWK